MFELARLELRWLTRPSRSALIRGIRAAMLREGVFEAAGGNSEPCSEGLTSANDRSSMRASTIKYANWYAAPPTASGAAMGLFPLR